MKYIYFLSFNYSTHDGNTGSMNAQIAFSEKITNLNQLIEAEDELIKTQNFKAACTINFILLKEE